MKRYVDLTALYVPPGGPLFCSLVPPYKPLSANSLGRITKNLLKKLGVPMEVFGPHSTRGAGVKFYKDLEPSSEQVCGLGQWKNAGAFTTHYLRLGAAETAEKFCPHFWCTQSHLLKVWNLKGRIVQGLKMAEDGMTLKVRHKNMSPPTPPKRKSGKGFQSPTRKAFQKSH